MIAMKDQPLAFSNGIGKLFQRAQSAIDMSQIVQHFRDPKRISFAFTFVVGFCSIGSALLTFKLAAIALGPSALVPMRWPVGCLR